MSILSARKLVCNKLSEEFDALVKPVTDVKSTIKSQINQTKAKLSLLTFSPESEINSAISDLSDDVKGIIPEATPGDIDEIIDFIKGCDFLGNNNMLNNPIALLKGGVNSAISEASGFVNDLSDLLPEFDVGKILGSIFDKLSGLDLGLPGSLDISVIMQSLDKIINCIGGRCGSDFSARVSEMTNTLDELYDELNLVSDPTSANWGKFDIDKLYDDVALSASERLQMSNVVESVQSSKTAVTDAVSNTVNAAKSAARSVEGVF